MPITQIPFQDPVAPPEKPQPEQLGLYERKGWETAYRDLDDDAACRICSFSCRTIWRARGGAKRLGFRSLSTCFSSFVCSISTGSKSICPGITAVAVRAHERQGSDFSRAAAGLAKGAAPAKDEHCVRQGSHCDDAASGTGSQRVAKGSGDAAAGRPGLPRASSGHSNRRNRPPDLRRISHRSSSPAQPNPQIAQLQTPATPNIANEFKKYRRIHVGGSRSSRQPAPPLQSGAAGSRRRRRFWLGTGAHGRQLGNFEILSDTKAWISVPTCSACCMM